MVNSVAGMAVTIEKPTTWPVTGAVRRSWAPELIQMPGQGMPR